MDNDKRMTALASALRTLIGNFERQSGLSVHGVRVKHGAELTVAVGIGEKSEEQDLVAAFDELHGCDSEAHDGAPLEQLLDEIRG